MAEKREESGGTEQPIRIIIADDHSVLRMGLRMLLDAEPDLEVVGEAADGSEAQRLVQELAPDILLLDITMPEVGGLEVISDIKEICPETHVLMLTMHDDESYLQKALAAGASGYVLKQAADVELIMAIKAVHRGGTYLHPNHMRVLLRARDEMPEELDQDLDPGLSPREIEVLKLIALGYTNRQAADEMGLSVKTVETYRSRLMSKLDVHSRAELVRYAMQRGMLDQD